MNPIQWCKYKFYSIFIRLVPNGILLLFSSSNMTKWIRDIFFRPHETPEIITKQIKYFQFRLNISCPLQILYKAEKRGIEPSLSRMVMNELSLGNYCIDVGANYGFISLIMAQKVGSNGCVFSYESDPDIYKILAKNIHSNSLNNICSIGNYFISNITNKRKKKLDDLFEENSNKIKLIKIDTDGSDYNCLLGAEQLIKKDKPIIIIEINEYGAEIHNKLINFGYVHFYDQHYNVVKTNNLPPNLIASFESLL